MKIVIELKLRDSTRLDGVQQVQLRCVIEKIVEHLKKQGVTCQGYELNMLELAKTESPDHDCCGAWCADCF